MKELNEIFDMLDHNNPLELQVEGRALLREVGDISLLIMPRIGLRRRSDIWCVCANIVSERSDSELEPHLERLFEWIYEPEGGTDICIRLMSMTADKLYRPFIAVYELNLREKYIQAMHKLYSFICYHHRLRNMLPEEIVSNLNYLYDKWEM